MARGVRPSLLVALVFSALQVGISGCEELETLLEPDPESEIGSGAAEWYGTWRGPIQVRDDRTGEVDEIPNYRVEVRERSVDGGTYIEFRVPLSCGLGCSSDVVGMIATSRVTSSNANSVSEIGGIRYDVNLRRSGNGMTGSFSFDIKSVDGSFSQGKTATVNVTLGT